MAISKDFLWSTIAQLANELQRIDPGSVVAARVSGFIEAREMGLHTSDRHSENKRHYRTYDEQIVELYLSGKSTYDIARELDIAVTTVGNALRRKGVEARERGVGARVAHNKRNQPRIERIRIMRAEGKTLEEVGAELNITRERVRQICVKNGIDAERGLTPEQLHAVADYVAGDSLEQVAVRYAPTNPSTLKNWVLKAGFAIRPAPKTSKRDPETLKKAERAAEMYRAGETTSAIAMALGYGPNGGVIYRLLAIAGVKPDRGAFGDQKHEIAA